MTSVIENKREGESRPTGVSKPTSRCEPLYKKRFYFICNQEVHAMGSARLETVAWREGEWIEVVAKVPPKENTVGWIGNVVGLGDHALAITQAGEIYRFDGAAWEKTEDKIPDFKEEREDFLVSRSVGDDLIIWGGTVKNRKSNDTFLRTEGVWQKVKKASPKPKDFAHGKDGIFVGYQMYFDTALNCAVRLGFDEVHTWNGKLWDAHTPEQYTTLLGPKASEHFPMHDEKSGQTLLVNLFAERVVRFDLKGCVELASITPPEELDASSYYDKSVANLYREDYWFEPHRALLRAQHVKDKWAQYGWDMQKAFAAAAAMGERTLA